MRSFFSRLANAWAIRSLFAGGVSTIIDFSCVVAGVELFHLPKVPAGVAGVVIGSAFGFLLNKYFAFNDQRPSLPQALRYGLVFAAELGLWAGIDWVLIHPVGVPYPIAKFASDIVVFSGVHLVMLRWVVFPRGPSDPDEAGEEDAEGLTLPAPR